jgi:nucleoside-diphosphate-sugar epimerase
MNLLLTGGTGYIGSHTPVMLPELGHKVVLYDNLSNSSDSVPEKLAQIIGQTLPFIRGDVRDSVNAAAKELGLQIYWEEKGIDEKGYDTKCKCIVAVDPRHFRPTEVETLLCDPAKAKEKLGRTPKTTFSELVAEMVGEDLKFAKWDELIKHPGFKVVDYHE